MNNSNTFANIALLLWPIVTLYFVSSGPAHKAIVKSVLGAFLLLPVGIGFNLDLLPLLNKETIPVISLYFASLLFGKVKFNHFGKCKLSNLLIVIYIMNHFLMLYINQEIVSAGPKYIPGYTLHSTMSLILLNFLSIAFFFVGRNHFQKSDHQRYLFNGIIFSALIYTLFVLFELKMSPQLHKIVYGYFPHAFEQMKRAGGYRPVVFIGHGLLVSFFLAAGVLSASIFWKNKWRVEGPLKLKGKVSSLYLTMIVLFSKSVAPFVYSIFSIVCAIFLSARRTAFIALLLATFTLVYPLIKMNNLLPTEQILSLAESLTNSERALSLSVRFANEDSLLDKAKQKLCCGWGGWGRSRIYGQYGDETISDGYWIIRLGESGLLGFYSLFGLIFLSVYKANKAVKISNNEEENRMLAMHALLIAILLIDQLPNSSLSSSFWWLIIGALMGRSENVIESNKNALKRKRRSQASLA